MSSRMTALACLAALVPSMALGAEEFASHHENVMGTSLELRIQADSSEAARMAEDRLLAEIDRLSAVFSNHDPASEFRRWQASPMGPSRVSDELHAVLSAAEGWRLASGGAFDPRVAELSRLWTRAAGAGREPTTAELDEAVSRLSRPSWRPGPGADELERLSDAPLSLDAIAKGYIVERACAAAMRPGTGVRGILLNIGGDLRVEGSPARTIGIASPWADSESSEPIARIEVGDRAVATSGASQRGFRIGDRRYSHILDPRTGRPARGAAAATVIARRSADADALATIANVLPPDETLRLVRGVPDAECLIVAEDGRLVRSPGWSRFERGAVAEGRPLPLAMANGRATRPDPAPQPADAWSRDAELVVNFEINAPEGEGRRYRRPYIAVWIEDKDGQPVRTLTLWLSMGGAGPFQWIPDLKRWYRGDQLRKQKDKKELIFTIARPTRPPGKYRVIWDGKDDRGKPVPAGEYTIQIDAAREHGTYQNLRKDVTVGGEPFATELTGGVEVRSASIEYRKKAPAASPR